MQFTSFVVAVAALAGSAIAQSRVAYVTAEILHGGTPDRNTTINVPIDDVYTNKAVLDQVSTLYLIGSSQDVQADSITCTPFKSQDGNGQSALPFDINTPSRLSTNTVQVGSIVCHSA
ncbi:hypothetical protein M426DRAFT_316749 [Hypoxylon sp. CI-4A]|nr:hypothetical protein M426DRAFT_316749 [Hypoxylon sp. CI-4A]